MKPDIIKDEILDILESLKEQIPVLINYTKKIPQIELDIVMSNLRRIYENINELKNLEQIQPGDEKKEEKDKNTKGIPIEPPIVKSIKKEEESGTDIKTEEKTIILEKQLSKPTGILVKKEESEESDHKIPETPVKEPVKIVFESREEEIIQPKKKQIKAKDTVDLFSSTETSIADKYKNESKSINEKIYSDKEDKSIAAKMQKGQITDLKQAIGLNEKFLFINELFDGNMKAYTEDINALNNQETLEDARKKFEEIKLKNKWDENSDTYKKLLNLVERKF